MNAKFLGSFFTLFLSLALAAQAEFVILNATGSPVDYDILCKNFQDKGKILLPDFSFLPVGKAKESGLEKFLRLKAPDGKMIKQKMRDGHIYALRGVYTYTNDGNHIESYALSWLTPIQPRRSSHLFRIINATGGKLQIELKYEDFDSYQGVVNGNPEEGVSYGIAGKYKDEAVKASGSIKVAGKSIQQEFFPNQLHIVKVGPSGLVVEVVPLPGEDEYPE